MVEHPLYIAIVWHMHQPFYRGLRTDEVTLPWVRLHAAKDYLHMAEVLATYPDVHLTINMVPSLTEQVLAWAGGDGRDELARLAEQGEWSSEDRRTILNLAYSISWDNVIRQHARYAELLDRRPEVMADPEAFSIEDYRDLLAWFNLAWIDPLWRARDATLAALVSKGRGFTAGDLRVIHDKQREIAGLVLPRYQELVEQGQLEVSTSPYYHPILPLLIDTRAGRRASPGLPLPSMHLAAPEDAAMQLQLAVKAHTEMFGRPPRGLWPSEGAVSQEVLPLAVAAGFEWLASDEAILGRSLGRPFERDSDGLVTNPRALYQSYRVLAGTELGPHVVFRDHELSDRIGFLYRYLPATQAAEDVICRLLQIRDRINDSSRPYLVSIILDGENAWENYEANGNPFLHALYDGLSKRRELRAVTVSEYLAEHKLGGTLAKLATGSWIGGDLTTWIGDPEHNRAWEALARTRAHLLQATDRQAPREAIEKAWQALYVAEGSDWFWWYSHRNRSEQDFVFDRLFRDSLAVVYEALEDQVPAWLSQPISQAPSSPDGRKAAGYISPRLTGSSYPGQAWALTAALQPISSTGAMQRADGLFGGLSVGHDRHNLYLRLDLRDALAAFDVALYLSPTAAGTINQQPRAHYADPGDAPSELALAWEIRQFPGQPQPFLFRAQGNDQWEAVAPVASALGEKVLEAAVPLQLLGAEIGSQIKVLAILAQAGQVVAQLPEYAMATFDLGRGESIPPDQVESLQSRVTVDSQAHLTVIELRDRRLSRSDIRLEEDRHS